MYVAFPTRPTLFPSTTAVQEAPPRPPSPEEAIPLQSENPIGVSNCHLLSYQNACKLNEHVVELTPLPIACLIIRFYLELTIGNYIPLL